MGWISVDEKLPHGAGDIVMIKTKDGEIIKAYYHQDQMVWLAFYFKGERSHFQDMQGNFLHNVAHWMYIPDYRKFIEEH